MLETVNLDNALAAQDAVNDAAYILAQTSSGETVKISKADLATVVAEKLGLSFIEFSSASLQTSEDGSYTYIPTSLSRRTYSPYCFACSDRAGWSFRFLSDSQIESWRLVVETQNGGPGSGYYSGRLYYAKST